MEFATSSALRTSMTMDKCPKRCFERVSLHEPLRNVDVKIFNVRARSLIESRQAAWDGNGDDGDDHSDVESEDEDASGKLWIYLIRNTFIAIEADVCTML